MGLTGSWLSEILISFPPFAGIKTTAPQAACPPLAGASREHQETVFI